jgi:signal transduction histidine kinase
MPAKPAASTPIGTAKQPRNPVSRRQIETVISRSVAIFGLVFGAQTLPITFAQFELVRSPWDWLFTVAIYGGLLASVAASLTRRFVVSVNRYVAIVFLVAMFAWPFVASDPAAIAIDRPWLWFLCTVATAAAAVAFSTWVATVYLVLLPIVYGAVRMTPSGGGKGFDGASLDSSYAIILGGAVLIIVTLLRQAAASVDAAQSAALDRYSNAVRQHATEVERVQVDAIVHDSVLTTLLAAARAYTPEAKELATRMAENAMGHLKDAASASPDDDAVVSAGQLSHRIVGAATTLSSPFELRMAALAPTAIPVQSAEAIYSAAVQAMVNSLQHAGGPEVPRWLDLHAAVDGGIIVEVGDAGSGFPVDAVPVERLGLRVSIVERITNAGGVVAVRSTIGDGTLISIRWPDPERRQQTVQSASGPIEGMTR